MNTPGHRLKILMLELRMKQADLAQLIGVTPVYISNIANDKSELQKHIALAIAQVTGCNPIWLLAGEGEMFLDKRIGGHNLDPDELEIVELWRNLPDNAKSYARAAIQAFAVGKKK